MLRLSIHPHVREDLKRLTAGAGVLERQVKFRLLSLLDAFRQSPSLQQAMLTQGNFVEGDKAYDTAQWIEQKRKTGLSLWRLKQVQHFDFSDETPILARYRIIYKVESLYPNDKKIIVLAVVDRREFNYEDGTTELSRRILQDAQ